MHPTACRMITNTSVFSEFSLHEAYTEDLLLSVGLFFNKFWVRREILKIIGLKKILVGGGGGSPTKYYSTICLNEVTRTH